MGSAGQVIMFVVTLALFGLVCTFVFAYAARCFFSITTDSAAGNDEHIWPDEPLLDWVFQGGYLLYLLGIWLVPVGIILRTIDRDFFINQSVIAATIGGIVLWLFFPLGTLSAMSAESRWVPFRAAIFGQLMRKGGQTALFYLLSFGLLVVGLGPWLLVLGSGSMALVLLAGAFSMASFLIYARLLGRLGWIISGMPTERRKEPLERKNINVPVVEEEQPAPVKKKKKPPKKKKDPPPREKEEEIPMMKEVFTLPEAEDSNEPEEDLAKFLLADEKSTAVENDEDDLKLVPMPEADLPHYSYEPEEDTDPYELTSEPVLRPPVDLPTDGYSPIDDDDDEPYDMDDDGFEVDEMEELEEQEERPVARKPRRRRLRRPKPPPRAPHSLIKGVLNFPFYGNVIPVWLTLSLGATIVGMLGFFLASMKPG